MWADDIHVTECLQFLQLQHSLYTAETENIPHKELDHLPLLTGRPSV